MRWQYSNKEFLHDLESKWIQISWLSTDEKYSNYNTTMEQDSARVTSYSQNGYITSILEL